MSAYLLVFLARNERWLPGTRWIDRNNDPEQRAWPMTYGICRGNFRRTVDVGDEVFFVGFDRDGLLDGGYHLSSCLVVSEKIDQAAAAVRFRGRPNVILEALGDGDDALDYALRHRPGLRWPGKSALLRLTETNARAARRAADDHVVRIGGTRYVHAWWDNHDDWKTARLRGPYVIGDSSRSVVAESPIPYEALTDRHSALPTQLRVGGRYPHGPAKLLTPEAARVLRDALGSVRQRTVPTMSVPPEVDRYRATLARIAKRRQN